jgi:hypothetical protein
MWMNHTNLGSHHKKPLIYLENKLSENGVYGTFDVTQSKWTASMKYRETIKRTML